MGNLENERKQKEEGVGISPGTKIFLLTTTHKTASNLKFLLICDLTLEGIVIYSNS